MIYIVLGIIIVIIIGGMMSSDSILTKLVLCFGVTAIACLLLNSITGWALMGLLAKVCGIAIIVIILVKIIMIIFDN